MSEELKPFAEEEHKYTYFVFYHYKKDGTFGVGSSTFKCRKKIKSIDDVLEIQENIRGANGHENVAVSHWTELSEGEG